jgi:hypothetical protein
MANRQFNVLNYGPRHKDVLEEGKNIFVLNIALYQYEQSTSRLGPFIPWKQRATVVGKEAVYVPEPAGKR